MKNNKFIGGLGEEIACTFLMKRGYSIIERNYLRKWGEIDIVAEKEGIIHFAEVKSATVKAVIHETKNSEYRPEENVHPFKLKKLRRVIQSYMLEHKIEEGKWCFDVLVVKMNHLVRSAKVYMLEDIVL